MPSIFSLDFPYAYGEPEVRAGFRSLPEYFQVDEFLGFAPAGEGEHVYLQVWKRGENTAWVAEKIAQLAGVAPLDVGYCGRKDRHAVTTQWFSVYLPKQSAQINWSELNCESINLLKALRHHHKLRRGDHQANRFVIRLSALECEDKPAFERKLEIVLSQGVPNYYGEQRFGRGGNNLVEAEAMLVGGVRIRDKQKRGLMLSAARSYLFNQVLAARVQEGTWQHAIAGEPEPFPTAPLWGRGRSLAAEEALRLESGVLAPWAGWCDGLEHAGLSQERRPLVLKPELAEWRWLDRDLELSFSLGSGEFATTVLRELAILQAAPGLWSVAV